MSTEITTKSSAGPRRIALIGAVTDLFLENGFSGTSMNAVAKACGITKASLYHHFPGKEDLFAACVTHGYASALARLSAIADDPSRSPRDKMPMALGVCYETIIDTPVGRMSPLIAEVSRTFPNVAQSFHTDYIVPQKAILRRLLEAGVASGAFRDIDFALFSHIVFGPIVTLSLSREMFATFEDLDDHFPVAALRCGHIDMVMDLLTQGR